MRYLPTIKTSKPETLSGLQPGQWIDYLGVAGRYMGRRNGIVWIAWDSTAKRRFRTFAQAFHAIPARLPRVTPFNPLNV